MHFTYKKKALVIIIATSLFLSQAKAEIPFTQALGVYEYTKENRKHLSPFWGFVALHSKMLENIRFFGNYSKSIVEEIGEDGNIMRHEVDIPNDKIAGLIKRLFNSSDGIQFVATEYEGDPVGNLSRNLPAINDIIQILVESQGTKQTKINQITKVLNSLIPGIKDFKEVIAKIAALKADSTNKNFSQESDIVLAAFNSVYMQHKNAYDLKKLKTVALNSLSLSANYVDDELQRRLNQKALDIERALILLPIAKLLELSQLGDAYVENIQAGNLNKVINDLSKKSGIPVPAIKQYSEQARLDLENKYEISLENSLKKILISKVIKKIMDKNEDDLKIDILKEMHIEHNSSFACKNKTTDLINNLKKQLETEQNEKAVLSLSPLSLVPIALERFEKDSSILANLLVDAYEAQEKLANPVIAPETYLYPENIVVTSLLAFFVKVANSKTELNNLPFLMDNRNPLDDTYFTKEQYFQHKNNIDEFIQNSKENPEPIFLMALGFDAYESNFFRPINYRTSQYQGKSFADCGETSLRNVLQIFLSANNGGVISEEALEFLSKKIILPAHAPLEEAAFFKLLSYLRMHPNLVSASLSENHNEWAEMVSDLNQGRAPMTLNDVYYGRPNENGVNIFEIKSIVHPDVRGIVNMFNVVAKLIPDKQLNEPWSQNKEERFKQISKKLDRFCELLSWGDLKLSWQNDRDKSKNVDNEFISIVFKNRHTPFFKWQFVHGHFQFRSIRAAIRDWRLKFKSQEEKTFSNEWMAALFLESEENKWLKNDSYGAIFPLSLIYSKDLLSADGALKIVSFVLYKNKENKSLIQFQPLVYRWIEKSIPLNDLYAVNKVSMILYSCNDFQHIQKLLTRSGFEHVNQEVNKYVLLEKTNPNEVLALAAKHGLNTELCLISKKPAQWTSLNLDGNRKIMDEALIHLGNLTNLNLANNAMITNEALAHLSNLTNLNLASNEMITNEALLKLTNLTNLNLDGNQKITNEGLAKLTNLTSLSLAWNQKITDYGIVNLKNLTSLFIHSSNMITNKGIAILSKLTRLKLGCNKSVTDVGIIELKNLTSLETYQAEITDYGIAHLTNLTSLVLDSEKITDHGLGHLKNLTDLKLSWNSTITDNGIAKLTNLTRLELIQSKIITGDGMDSLPNLKEANLYFNRRITLEKAALLRARGIDVKFKL
jgi:hypothetical protein